MQRGIRVSLLKIKNDNKEDIIHWFEVLKNKCDRVTTGNCSHEINSIRFLASNWASRIKKEQGETMFYHNFIGISEVCTKVTFWESFSSYSNY